MSKIEIEDVVYGIVESLSFDNLIYLAHKINRLDPFDADIDIESWLDDDYPDKEAEVKTELQQKLCDLIDPPKEPEVIREHQALQTKNQKLKTLLTMAGCPNCDGSGAYYNNYGNVCQCQWCYEKEEALKDPDPFSYC
jgi:hypothetical protein